MIFLREYITAFAFFLTITVARNSEELFLLRHSTTDNGWTRQLTCVSKDDDAALIWNYYPDVNDVNNKENAFTNFEPEKPPSKNAAECAVWNFTECLVNWGEMNGWGVVHSAQRPMGPVFDYRWEGFKEFVSEKLIQNQEPQYVGQVNRASHGSVVFSVRGVQDIHIFLCESEYSVQGCPCFWIIIGSSGGHQSAIKSCLTEGTNVRQTAKEGNCVEIASVIHGPERVIDAYEWRTFRLEWSKEDKKIRVFRETEVEPFLEGKVRRWPQVSHLSVKNEISSRVRFHFYEYFLAEKKDAVISTGKFIHHDQNFCVELFIGLCPECRLNFTLVDSRGDSIPIASISGAENSVSENKLVAWRSVRLNAHLPDSNARQVKLKAVTVLEKDGVEGVWAMDNFRTCKSVVGLRESTITTHQEMLEDPFWPAVNCQKLSYTASSVVDLFSSYPDPGAIRKHIFEGAPKTNRSRKTSGGILRSRKARGLDDVKLEVYEADPKTNTISLRLSPHYPAEGGIDQYLVSIKDTEDAPSTFEVSERLKCALWEDSVCFEKYSLPSPITLAASKSDADLRSVKVAGMRKHYSQSVKQWTGFFPLNLYAKDSSEPTNLTITSKNDGIVTVKWQHPWMPRSKIEEFNILFAYEETKLSGYQGISTPIFTHYPIEQAQKEYSTDLRLRTSTKYYISVTASKLGKNHGEASTQSIWVVSGVAFADEEELQLSEDGTSIQLELPRLANSTTETSISVVVEGPLTCTSNQSSISSLVHLTEWTAAEYTIDEYEQESLIVIGGNQTNETPSNCSLHPGETYTIKVSVTDESSQTGKEYTVCRSRNVTMTSIFPNPNDSRTPSKDGEQNLIWIIIFPIFSAILLPILLIWYRKRKALARLSSELGESAYVNPISLATIDRTSSTDHVLQTIDRLKIPEPILQSCSEYEIPDEPYSRSVSMTYFEEYVKEAIDNGVLRTQFVWLRKVSTRPCQDGSLPQNMPKNRDERLIAYDDTRIVLTKILDDPCSDYINASYVQGYKKKRAYIATQGPLPNTVNDFWRMVWQEGVRVICMLTNVVEGNETKCEKYWPDSGTNKKYGYFFVSNTDHQVFPDYTFRTFELSYKRDRREIRHLHYTGWPSHRIPTDPQSLVAYLKKLKSIPYGKGPVVVHCQNGDGRTGTVILSDICLRRAAVEEVIDVPAVAKTLRDCRANMVSTVQQYLLAHIIVMESMASQSTLIPCAEILPERIRKMKMQLPSDLQRLKNTIWQDKALQDFAERSSLTEDCELAELVRGDPGEANSDLLKSSSVAAVSVDGVMTKKAYLACCLPSPFTVSNFWAFAIERNIKLIIILQCSDPRNPTCYDILPNDLITVPMLEIKIEDVTNPGDEEYFKTETLRLTNRSEGNAMISHSVTVITCKGWGRGENGEPPSSATLVSLWRASEKILRKEDQTLVLCHNGITGCRLYLALSFLLERMAVERECDVVSAVRAVRRSGPEFMQSLKQCEYLYDAAETYAEYFQCYANFY